MLMGVKLHVRRTEREHTVVIKKKNFKKVTVKQKWDPWGDKVAESDDDEERIYKAKPKKGKNTIHNIHVKERKALKKELSMRRRKKVKTQNDPVGRRMTRETLGQAGAEHSASTIRSIKRFLLNPHRPPRATAHNHHRRPHPHQCRCRCPPTYQCQHQHLPHHPVHPSAPASTPEHHRRSQKIPQEARSGQRRRRATTAQRETRRHFLLWHPSSPYRR